MESFDRDLEIRLPHISVFVSESRCPVTQSKPIASQRRVPTLPSPTTPTHLYPTLLLSTNGYRPATPRTLVPDTTAATPARGRMTVGRSTTYS